MDIFSHAQAYAVFEGTDYAQSRKEPAYPEGFRERLEGKPVEEQLRMFAVVERTEYTNYSYGDVDKSQTTRSPRRVENLPELRGLIVEDGLVEGIVVKDYRHRLVPVGPGDEACTYYACDDDGVGGSSRDDSVTLVCLPPDDEWE